MKNQYSSGQKKSGSTTGMGTYVVLAMALGAMTFFGVCSPQGPQGELTGPAASVDGDEISRAEFLRAYEQQSNQMRSQYGEEYDPQVLRVAAQTVDRLIENRVLYHKAQGLGLAASSDEVVSYLTEQEAFTDKKGAFSQEYFKNFLRANQYSEASFQKELQRSLAIQKLQQLISSTAFTSDKAIELEYMLRESKINLEYLKIDPNAINVVIADKDVESFVADGKNKDKIKAWYEAHRSDYLIPEKAEASHILISYKGARNVSAAASKRDKSAAKAKATKVLAKVKADPSKFADIAKAETDEPQGKKSGGDLGSFTKEDMVKEFSDAAFALTDGQVSELVESPFGFHIIKLTKKIAGKNTSLDQATVAIARKLLSQEKAPAIAESRANEVLKMVASKNAKTTQTLKNYELKWAQTGSIALTARHIPGLGSKQEISDVVLKLRKDKPLHDKVLKSGKNYFIVRLLDFVEADKTKLDDTMKQQIRNMANFSEGYSFLSDYRENAKKEYEDKKLVFRNPAYLAIDNPRPSE